MRPPAEGGRADRQGDVRGVGAPDRHHLDALDLVGEPLAPGVVHVDHGQAAAPGGEEAGLGGEVGLHRVVVVEVVMAQVGEGADVEADPVDPVLGQRVGGDLHGHRPAPGVAEAGQQRLELGGLGGGPLPGEGADHSGRHPGCVEDRPYQLGHGGLAIGAGHPDGRQVAGGMVEEGGRRQGHGRPDPAGRHPGLGDVDGHEALAEQGGGPAPDRLGGVVVAVGGGSGHAAEERAEAGPAAVEVDGVDLDAVHRAAGLHHLDVGEQAGQQHGRAPGRRPQGSCGQGGTATPRWPRRQGPPPNRCRPPPHSRWRWWRWWWWGCRSDGGRTP